jgi:predicted RNase H-like nuclease
VIESYPGGAQDVLGIPRKLAGAERLRRSLVRRGFRGDIGKTDLTHDELDAITCAWVGRLDLEGASEALGDAAEGQIVMPRDPRYPLPPRSLVSGVARAAVQSSAVSRP